MVSTMIITLEAWNCVKYFVVNLHCNVICILYDYMMKSQFAGGRKMDA